MTDTTNTPDDDPQKDEIEDAPEEASTLLPHPTPTDGEAPAP